MKLLVSLLFLAMMLAAGAQALQLPALHWTPRSDWINVKDPATFPAGVPAVAAKGDGVADDTAALQALLTALRQGDTLYFPPGKYRITQTLKIEPDPQVRGLGITLIGHGRDSVICWDGELDGVMFLQHAGWAISRYVGLTWDGHGMAATGVRHRSMKVFETEVRHDCEAFIHFTGDGIHLGGGALATAEIAFTNCLFDDCGTGIYINGGDRREDNNGVNFNYLDNTVRRCEFRHCKQGVYAGAGTNVYVRESHFAQIAGTVITTSGEAGNSVRHCSAQDFGAFIDNRSSVGPLTVQDCWLEGWRTLRDAQQPAGVITLRGGSAPCLLFDNTFRTTAATYDEVKDVALLSVNPAVTRYFLANNRDILGDRAPEQVPLRPALNGAEQHGYLLPVPAGDGEVTSADQCFFRTELAVPSKIFDARVDFGAKGDGKTDDTAALQRTIDAARAYGKDALAYLPKGRYLVSAALTMTGSHYRVGGCGGFGAAIVWKGPETGTTLQITDPDGLVLENIVIGRHDYPQGKSLLDIQQTSTPGATASRMTYENVAVFGMYQGKPLERGLQLLNLKKGDVVNIDEVNGNIRVTDCADAVVYLGLSYEGTVTVDGKSPARRGFIGGDVRLGTVSNPGVWIRDNQSFTISDLYCESSKQYMRMDGDPALPAGVVTVSGPKFEIEGKAALTTPSVQIDNYKGDLLVGPYNYYVGNKQHWFRQTGDAPMTLLLWAGSFYNSAPKVEAATARYLAVGLRRMGERPAPEELPLFQDTGDNADALAKAALAVRQLRLLGFVGFGVTYGPRK